MSKHIPPRIKVFFSRAMEGIDPDSVKAQEMEIAAALNSLGMSISNPFKKKDERRTRISGISEIVDDDLSILAASHIVLADLSIPGRSYVGALFELAHAYNLGKQIYVWVGDSGNEKRIWLKYHSTAICKTFDEILEILYMIFTSEGRKVIAKETIEYYSTIAAKYEEKEKDFLLLKRDPETRDRYIDESRALHKWVEGFRVEGTIVDLGSGTGPWVPNWIKHASRVICVDLSAEMLNISRQNNNFENVEHIQGDILDKKWLKSFLGRLNELDVIALGFILNSFTIEQEEQLLNSLRRLVSPGVRLILLESMSSPFSTNGYFSRTEIQSRPSPNNSRVFKLFKRNFLPKDARCVLKKFGDIEDLFYTENYFVSGIACAK